MTKELFFTKEYIALLQKLQGNEKGNWGVLSAQEMIEHMTDSIGIAYGRIKQTLHTSEEMLPKFREFALSDKEFKPNTKNAYMGDNPEALRNKNITEAVSELEKEIISFISYYKNNPDAVVQNPFFGNLNYHEWLHLLHKHAIHHLKQFNLI